jgi:uncharacterized membrane protein YtjA (UPF0391 family)
VRGIASAEHRQKTEFVPVSPRFSHRPGGCGYRNFRSHDGLVLHLERCSLTLNQTQERVMLSWVVTFLIIALIAGLLGFGGIAGASIEIAKIVFFVAIVLFLISAVVGLSRRKGGV